MRAVVLDAPGPPEALVIRNIQAPGPAAGWVLIKVQAFGLNRSEVPIAHSGVYRGCVDGPGVIRLAGPRLVLACVPRRRIRRPRVAGRPAG